MRLLGAGAVLALTAVARPAVALDCGNWNTKAFFVTATRSIIQDCLDSGADPNARGTWGYVDGVTPLHWVAERADITVISMLLDAGANPKTPNELGWTPLHMAAWGNKNPAIISMLLDAGSDLEAQTKNGRTPLHMAAINNTVATIMTTLIDAGADVNARADRGFTPLHWAAQRAEHSVVTRLLQAEADPKARTESGHAPSRVTHRVGSHAFAQRSGVHCQPQSGERQSVRHRGTAEIRGRFRSAE